MQDGRVDEGRELGLAPHHLFGLAADARPDRIDLVERVRGSCVSLRHTVTPATDLAGNPSHSLPSQIVYGGKKQALQGVTGQFRQAAGPGSPARPVLNTLSPTASMWSRPGMSSERPCGSSAASSGAEPATSSLLPTATSTGSLSLAQSSRDSVWREPRIQAASALRSDLVCSAKARNVRPCWSLHVGERRRLERVRDRFRQPDTVDQPAAEPAEHDTAHAIRMRQRQKRRDARAHRIAHHVGARDIEMIEQRPHVLGHHGAVIGGRIVELGRGAMAAIVERDHAPAGAGQRRDPARDRPSSPPWWRRSRARARSARPRLHRDRRSRRHRPNGACGRWCMSWHDPPKPAHARRRCSTRSSACRHRARAPRPRRLAGARNNARWRARRCA